MNNIIVKTVGDMKSRIKIILISIISLVILSACIPGNGYNNEERIAGFWMGMWHGLIAPISLIISIFSRDIRIYEVFNKGIMYDFGFFTGFWFFVLHTISALIIDKKNPCVKNKPLLTNKKCAKFIVFGYRFCLEKCKKYRDIDDEEIKNDDTTKISISIGTPEIIKKIHD